MSCGVGGCRGRVEFAVDSLWVGDGTRVASTRGSWTEMDGWYVWCKYQGGRWSMQEADGDKVMGNEENVIYMHLYGVGRCWEVLSIIRMCVAG